MMLLNPAMALAIALSAPPPWQAPTGGGCKHHNKKPAQPWPAKKKARKAAQASRRNNRK